MTKYKSVSFAVEIVFTDGVTHAVGGFTVDQQTAENGLLRLQRMRRQFQCFQLGIVRHVGRGPRNPILLRGEGTASSVERFSFRPGRPGNRQKAKGRTDSRRGPLQVRRCSLDQP